MYFLLYCVKVALTMWLCLQFIFALTEYYFYYAGG